MNAIYQGRVEHRRLRPLGHALGYDVFAFLIDVDAPPKGLRLFSFNRFNLFSVMEKDHGAKDGRPLGAYVRDLIGARAHVEKVLMLAYPRVLGFAFNPLTTYYCFDGAGKLVFMVYEVTNTFGNRVSYVIPVEGGVPDQSCAKRMWVSPFNRVEGQYGFHGNVPGQSLSLGVNLKDKDGPKLKAWFRAQRRPFTDGELVRQFLHVPFLGFKVVLAIHWQALKLWLKGLAYVSRPAPPEPHIHLPRSKGS